MADTVRDNKVICFKLLSIVLSVWDFIKNSGKYLITAKSALRIFNLRSDNFNKILSAKI